MEKGIIGKVQENLVESAALGRKVGGGRTSRIEEEQGREKSRKFRSLEMAELQGEKRN